MVLIQFGRGYSITALLGVQGFQHGSWRLRLSSSLRPHNIQVPVRFQFGQGRVFGECVAEPLYIGQPGGKRRPGHSLQGATPRIPAATADTSWGWQQALECGGIPGTRRVRTGPGRTGRGKSACRRRRRRSVHGIHGLTRGASLTFPECRIYTIYIGHSHNGVVLNGFILYILNSR